MYKYAAIALLVASAMAVPAPEGQATGLNCMQHEDLFSCLAVRAVNTLERAARSADVKVFEGVTFVRDSPVERSGKAMKPETELLNELPRDATDKTLQLANMLFESAVSFLKSHSLKIDMPEVSVSRALDEGRKMKKMMLPVIAAVGVKILALVPILLGGLALLVVKALFVGKIALLLAGILAFQRLFSGSPVSSFGSSAGFGGFGSNFFGKNQAAWSDGASQASWNGNQGQGYYRSFSDKVADAHSLAYSAQAPAATATTN